MKLSFQAQHEMSVRQQKVSVALSTVHRPQQTRMLVSHHPGRMLENSYTVARYI